MARLRRCIDCGNSVSRYARKCPRCGSPRPFGYGCFMRFVFLVWAFFIFLFIASVMGW